MLRHRLPRFAALAALAAPAALAAQPPVQPGALLTLLGRDTIAVERLSATPGEVRAEVLLRVPRTSLRVYRLRLDAQGRPETLETTTHDPAAGPTSPPLARELIRWAADSLRIETTAQGAAPTTAAVAGGHEVLPFLDMVHWPFELMLRRAQAAGGDSLAVPLLSGRRTSPFVVRRLAPREFAITHPTRGSMRVRVDERGSLAQLDAAQTTRKLLVTRQNGVELERLAREFATRPAFGELSGRGADTASIAGATLRVDYGRPAKRGREVFGRLVPWGQVWRTGANRATHFATDRALLLGGTPIPAGEYTLFTVPRAEGWTLIVNLRTNITGTAHDPAHDLARIEMRTRALPEVVEDFTIRLDRDGPGGVLRLQWDRTEAFVPFTLQPAG